MSAVSGFHVVLEEDCPEEAAAKLQEAILQMRGVISVDSQVTSYSEWAARQRINREIKEKLFKVFATPDYEA